MTNKIDNFNNLENSDNLPIKNTNVTFTVYNILNDLNKSQEKFIQLLLHIILIVTWQITEFYNWEFSHLLLYSFIMAFVFNNALVIELTKTTKIILLILIAIIGSIFLVINDRMSLMPWNILFWVLISKFYLTKQKK